MQFLSSSFLAKCAIPLLAFACLSRAAAQEPAVEAELSHELSGDRLQVGSVFELKVRSPWKGEDCRLSPGSLLHATVKTVKRAPSGHTEEFIFRLGAACGDKEPIALVVTSLLAPPKVETSMEQFPGFGSIGGAGKQPQANPATFSGSDAMRGTAQAVTTSSVTVNKLPATVKLGEVWRLPHIQLVVPSGDGLDSTVGTAKGSIRLPEGTLFVLQGARSVRRAEGIVPVVAGRATVEEAHSVHPFVTACRAGRCSAYAAAQPMAGFGFRELRPDEDLAKLGLRGEHDREVSQLEPGTTVHFTGDRKVLLTFPTHALVKRTGNERPTDEPRSVRAVLLDIETRAVERVLDWTVDDHNTYVWAFGQNLLVHEGQALRVYGPSLQEVAAMALTMPLASLQVSPDGEHLLLGELHELHTAEEHQSLVEGDKHGPQEEVLWSLLDGHLERIKTLGSSSNRVPVPVLFNEGMIELRKGREPEWFLVERSWEGGSERQLGGLRSSCLPSLGAVRPDLLTVATCDVSGDAMHTFAVRADGSPVLTQASGGQDLPLSFVAASAAPKLAMMMTRGSEAYSRGLLFHLSVIRHQAVEVLGAERGEVVACIPLAEVAPYREPFALSPDGATLAVLSGQHLRLYALQP